MFTSFPFAFWRGGSGATGLGYRYGYEFDGVDEQIDFNSHLTLSGNFSVSTWFKTTSTGTGTIIADWGDGTRAFQMRLSSGKLQVFTSNGGIGFNQLTSTLDYNTGDWYNAVFTWGPTGDGILYVNGVNVDETTAYTYYPLYQSSNNLIIGDNQFSGANFDGRLDDVQVYDFELNATQVSDIYNSGYVTAPTASPIHHWKLGEEDTFSTNWTVKDSVGSLDGTSVNMEEVDRKLGVAYSLDFDGVDEYVDFGNILDTDGTTPFTFACWYNAGTSSGVTTIMAKHDASLGFQWAGFNESQAIYIRGTGGTVSARSVNSTVKTGVWTFIAVTYDGSGDYTGFTFYDKNFTRSPILVANTFSGSASNSANFKIGDRNNDQYGNGKKMELSVYDTELSASDVALLFNETGTGNGVPIDPRNVGLSPIFYCPMVGENDSFSTNWTITDEIAGNNGTSVNMEEADKTSDTP